jgi:hypothetical protein
LGLIVGLMMALAAPASAATTQISGVGFFDTTGECPDPPAGYEDFVSYPPIVMTGSLEGCWYTKVETSKDNGTPSGVYQERGEEVFVGSLDGGPVGTFATTYKFTSTGIRTCPPAQKFADAASTRSLRVAAPAASRVPPAGPTSRMTS